MDNLLALPVGTELAGDYRIQKVLGAGGFGITYLAEETPLNRGVAIKEYFPSDFAAREGTTLVRSKSRGLEEDYKWGLERFIEEAQALATFDHANIVRVYRYFRQNNTGYMVLKLEHGMSFKAWLGTLGRKPSQDELDAIARPLLDALELIHARSFLHRDIAPDNIIIRPDGSPVLIDFGSARREVASHLSTLSVLVKPGYSPAEQYAQDGKRQGPWTDIYALAATLYHAVVGKRPSDSPARMQRDDLALAMASAQGSYRKGFLKAIDAALQLAIEARPQSIAAWRPMLLELPAAAMAQRGTDRAVASAKTTAQTRKLDSDELKPIRLKPKRAPAVKPAEPALALPEAKPSVSGKPIVLPPSGKPPMADFIRAMTPIASAALVNARSGAREAINWLQQAMPRKVAEAPPREKRRGLIERLEEAKPADADVLIPPRPRVQPAPEPVTQLVKAAKPPPVRAAAPQAATAQPSPAARPRAMLERFRSTMRGLLIRLLAVAAIAGAIVTVEYWGPLAGLIVTGTTPASATDVSLIRALRGHAVAIEAMTVASDGAFIASAGSDGQILVWDGNTGDRLRSIAATGSAVTALASSEHVVLAGRADGSIGLWQMDTGEKLGAFDENDGPVWGAVFLGSARQFATVGQDTKVRLWDAGRGVRSVWSDHKKSVFAIAYSGRARLLATAGADKTVKLWDERRRRLIRTYTGHTEDVRAVALSPDGQTLASAGNDMSIMLWPATSDAPLRTLTGHTNRVVTLAFSPDGRMLASGSEDGTVRLWDAATGALLNTYEGHVMAVRAVAFLPDGHRLASAGDDFTVRLWNAKVAGYP